MNPIKLSALILLLTCLSSCKTIELDWFAGSDNGTIKNLETPPKIIETNEPAFNQYGCLHIDEIAKLAKYLKRNCN